MTGTGLPIALIGILMALWLVEATVAIWIGLSMRSKSNKMLRGGIRGYSGAVPWSLNCNAARRAYKGFEAMRSA